MKGNPHIGQKNFKYTIYLVNSTFSRPFRHFDSRQRNSAKSSTKKLHMKAEKVDKKASKKLDKEKIGKKNST